MAQEKLTATVSVKNSLNKDDVVAWCKNILIFSSPVLAIFFGLLAQGVPVSKAWPVALYALYSILADLFKKWSGTTIRLDD